MLIALAATTATPAESAAHRQPTEVANAKAQLPIDPMVAMTSMLKLMDKLFPAGPEPDPVRLALGRQAAMTIFPKGTVAQAMNGFVNRTVDRALDMSEADFVSLVPPAKDKKNDKDKPPSTEPLRVVLAKKDPNFDAKLAAIRAFAGTFFVKFGDIAEPKLREGVARAMARKFDARQFSEIQSFLSTPTGAAYGREMVGMWFEPDVMRGSFEMLPDMMKMMPSMTKDSAALDAQMKAISSSRSAKKPN
jgi:hypothetical protein